MKIATWNIERLQKNKRKEVLAMIQAVNADIMVLTETRSTVALEGYHSISTEPLPALHDGIPYTPGEVRTCIFSRYPILKVYETYDPYTSVCADIDTPMGILTVYGTIIGALGNKQPKFNEDLFGQLDDYKRIFPQKQVCLIGDFNIIFQGFAFPSHQARNTMNSIFEELNLVNTTTAIENNVDHIVLSRDFIDQREYSLSTWNEDKRLSDHWGVCLRI